MEKPSNSKVILAALTATTVFVNTPNQYYLANAAQNESKQANADSQDNLQTLNQKYPAYSVNKKPHAIQSAEISEDAYGLNENAADSLIIYNDNKAASIPSTILAGDGTTQYTVGNGLQIDDNNVLSIKLKPSTYNDPNINNKNLILDENGLSLNNKLVLDGNDPNNPNHIPDSDKMIDIDGTQGQINVGTTIKINSATGTNSQDPSVSVGGIRIAETTETTNDAGNSKKTANITGLSNITWDSSHITSGRAATEDQLKDALESVPSPTQIKAGDNKLATLAGDNNNTVTIAGDSKNIKTSIGADGNLHVTLQNELKDLNSINVADMTFDSNGIDAGNKVIQRVGNAAHDTDAVNYGQLKSSGFTVKAGDNNTTKVTLNSDGNSNTITIAGDSKNIHTTIDKQGTLHVNLNKDVDLSDSGSFKVAGTTIDKDTFDAGNKTIKNAGNAVSNTDAVNYGQLKSSGFTVKAGNNKTTTVTLDSDGNSNTITIAGNDKNIHTTIDKQGTLHVNLNKDVDLSDSGSFKVAGTTIDKDTFDVGNKTIKNVDDGQIASGSKDAVNGGQLYDKLDAAKDDLTKKGFTIQAGDGKEIKTKLGGTVTIAGDNKNIKTSIGADNKLHIALQKDIDLTEQGSLTIGNTFINTNGFTIASGSSGNNSIVIEQNNISMGGNVIHNIATPELGTDAVNKDYVDNQVTDAKNNDKYLVANPNTNNKDNDHYTVSKDNTVDLKVTNGKDEHGNPQYNTVTIDNVAKADDVGKLEDLNEDLKGSSSVVGAINKVDSKVGDGKYAHDDGSDLKFINQDDNLTEAVGKLDSAIGKNQAEAQANRTEVHGDNNAISVTDTNKDPNKHNYEVSLNSHYTMTGKDANNKENGNSIEVNADKGTLTVTGNDKDGHHSVVVDGQNATVHGLANTTWDAAKANNNGYADSTNAATEAQIQQAMNTTIHYDNNDTKTDITLNKDSADGVKLHNVADGKVEQDSKDAVNGGQLYTVQQQADTNSQNINELSRSFGELDRDTRKGIAGAAALAAMNPLDYDPDNKWNFTAGFGHYKGQSAAAIGTYYQPDENTMLNLGATVGNDDPLVNFGVTFKLGRSGKNGQSATTSRAAMAKKIEQLQQQNEILTQKLNELSQKVDQLSGMQTASSTSSASVTSSSAYSSNDSFVPVHTAPKTNITPQIQPIIVR